MVERTEDWSGSMEDEEAFEAAEEDERVLNWSMRLSMIWESG
jgi:hypothetical protein